MVTQRYIEVDRGCVSTDLCLHLGAMPSVAASLSRTASRTGFCTVSTCGTHFRSHLAERQNALSLCHPAQPRRTFHKEARVQCVSAGSLLCSGWAWVLVFKRIDKERVSCFQLLPWHSCAWARPSGAHSFTSTHSGQYCTRLGLGSSADPPGV